ncbi:TRZ/ATZ family hydrolase [Candidatus Thiothrix anitrata]|uniref:5-methylthioadenosine/S-adenosylhomocysteine deaminase n=1 Tax=Candidatus Thiothrix anitrata TaxID=2823902 RepID=A0ABX7X073_9GAMM|nr:TRZ/ATZ family hydrolase [Candidatus Thiothrix anitrata]QTR49359.1 TRZ/ATZ family hydrolase [Candidatus Thiothrix anitrata]
MEIELLVIPEWVITVNSRNQVLHHHAVAVDDSRIVDILPMSEAEKHYRPRQTVVLAQQALLPGLVNAHTHAAMALLKGLADDLPLMEWLQNHIWPAESRWADAQFVYDGSRLAIAEMIRSGTTCFNDMYFFPEQTAKAVQEAGIRACIGLIVIDFPTAWGTGPEDYLQKGLALHDQVADDPLLTTAFAPHAPYTVSDDPLKQVSHLACEMDMPIHMHVHETAFEVQQALAQHDAVPLARLDNLGLLDKHFLAVHMTQLTDEEIALLAEKGTHVIHCPESNLKLASGFCPVAKLLAAGVNVALGTDGNASNNDLDMLGEMRTAALIAKAVAHDASVVSAAQALRMATINGATALGLADTIGSLEIGKAADMIAVDLSALETQPLYDPVSQIVYCANRNQVTHTWVAGKALMTQRELTTLNITELLATAQAWQQKIGATS